MAYIYNLIIYYKNKASEVTNTKYSGAIMNQMLSQREVWQDTSWIIRFGIERDYVKSVNELVMEIPNPFIILWKVKLVGWMKRQEEGRIKVKS